MAGLCLPPRAAQASPSQREPPEPSLVVRRDEARGGGAGRAEAKWGIQDSVPLLALIILTHRDCLLTSAGLGVHDAHRDPHSAQGRLRPSGRHPVSNDHRPQEAPGLGTAVLDPSFCRAHGHVDATGAA